MNVLRRWQAEVFAGSDIAEKIGTSTCRDGTPDRTGNMIVTGSNISNQWAKYIKRSPMAAAFLKLYIGLNLIERHMSRTFNHHLNSLIPSSLGEFAKGNQLVKLGPVCGVGNATGAKSVS